MKKIIASIPPFSVAVKGWDLAEKGFANENKDYRKRQQWRSFFSALLSPSFAKKWFALLEQDENKLLVENRPRLYFKPFRVYMSSAWKRQQRLKVILDTYKYIFNKGGYLKQVVTSKEGLKLSSFKLKDGKEGVLFLGYNERYRKEGELVFSFVCDELGGLLTSASCAFEQTSNGWICRIGCVQGHKVDDENNMKVAQNQMHGFRPKAMIIYAIQEFSRLEGLAAVYGAGDNIQAYRKKHAIHLPWAHTISLDYNATWEEAGGKPSSEGWYELPLVAPRKSMEDIKSHKRAYYRRRYALMDELSATMGEVLRGDVLSKDKSVIVEA